MSFLFNACNTVAFVGFIAGIIYMIRQKNKKARNWSVRTDYKTVSRGKHQFFGGTDHRNVLVIGGCGFVGRVICDYLLDDSGGHDYNVFVLDAVPPKPEFQRPDITYVTGDIRHAAALNHALSLPSDFGEKMHSVIHTASILPMVGIPDEFMRSVNIGGLKQVISSCQQCGVSRLVYTSSATVLLDRDDKNLISAPEDHPWPKNHVDLYTQTKREAETIIKEANGKDGLYCGIGRPSGVYGSGDNVIAGPRLAGKDAFYIGTGEALIDFVHVNSVAYGHMCIEQHLADGGGGVANGQVYNLSNGTPTKYREMMGDKPDPMRKDGKSIWDDVPARSLPVALVTFLASFNEFSAKILLAPLLSAALSTTAIKFTQRSYSFDNSKAKREIGYKVFMDGESSEIVRWMVRVRDEKKKK